MSFGFCIVSKLWLYNDLYGSERLINNKTITSNWIYLVVYIVI